MRYPIIGQAKTQMTRMTTQFVYIPIRPKAPTLWQTANQLPAATFLALDWHSAALDPSNTPENIQIKSKSLLKSLH